MGDLGQVHPAPRLSPLICVLGMRAPHVWPPQLAAGTQEENERQAELKERCLGSSIHQLDKY